MSTEVDKKTWYRPRLYSARSLVPYRRTGRISAFVRVRWRLATTKLQRRCGTTRLWVARAGGSRAMAARDGDEMSNDEALRRVEHGGTIIIMDVPPGTEFGIDCTLFTVGEKFRGVKMVPPGLHLVLLGAAGNDVTRVAEFVRVAPADVHVRRWDPHTETFAPGTGHDPEQTARLELGARRHDFDSATGAYPAQSAEVWHRLTSHVTEHVLAQCGVSLGTRIAPGDPDQPLEACVRGGPEAAAARARAAKERAARERAETPTMNDDNDIPVAPSFGDAASRAPAGASPEEITALGHDPEARLRRAVDASWRDFLGSNQTAFVLFLLLGSEPALAHWKATTALMCDAAVSCAAAFAPLYEAFTASFAAQLDRAAETLFEDEDLSEFSGDEKEKDARRGGHNFLRAALVALTGGLREALDGHEQHEAHEEPAVVETRRRGRLLEKWALAKFGVDVAAERADAVKKKQKQNESGAFPFDPADEDAPAVAELAEGTYARMDDAGEDADAPATDAGDEQGARRMGWMVQ